MPINYKNYPANWKKEIRPRILARAQHRCEFCGIENYTIKPNGSKVVLTVAHLNHDITDNRDSNLRALCQKCHNTLDAEDRARHRSHTRYIKKEHAGQLRLFR